MEDQLLPWISMCVVCVCNSVCVCVYMSMQYVCGYVVDYLLHTTGAVDKNLRASHHGEISYILVT